VDDLVAKGRAARRHINDIEREYSRKLRSDRFRSRSLCDLLTEIQPTLSGASPDTPGSAAPGEPGFSRVRTT
jgi:hypothetical protein